MIESKEKHINQLIFERLNDISKGRTIFGFSEDFTFSDRILLEGRFIIMLDSVSIETVSLNNKKQKERQYNILYCKLNNINDNSMQEIIEVEDIVNELIHDEEILEKVMDIEVPEFQVSLEKIKDGDLTGILNISITLNIKEVSEV